jgi:hypothetical protein
MPPPCSIHLNCATGLEHKTAEQQGDQQGVTQLLVRTSLDVTEMPFGPAVKLTNDGSSASTVMETVWLDTVSIFCPLGAIEQVMARALNEVF